MKKVLLLLLTFAWILTGTSAFAQADAESSIRAMLPVLDSILRASWELDRAYNPADAEYFWTVLGYLSVNWEAANPQSEVLESELRVPRLLMREYASAAFLEYDDLLPLPEAKEDFFVRYDASWDAYFVRLGDMGESTVTLRNWNQQEDGSISVELTMDAPDVPQLCSLRASMVANPYADSVAEPTFLWSVSAAEYRAGIPVSRTRSVTLDGAEEALVESRYTSALGFTVWLDGVHFYASGNPAEEGFERFSALDAEASLEIVPVEIPAEEAKSFLQEAVGDFPADASIGQPQELTLDSGKTCPFQEATSGAMTYRYYLLTDAGKTFAATAQFPKDASQTWGARLEILVKTFEIA